MATAFPGGLDSFLNPVGTDLLDNATAALKHATQHDNINDSVAALEAKVGIDGSAATTSLDYAKNNTCVTTPQYLATNLGSSSSSNAFKGCLFTPTASIHVHGIIVPITTLAISSTYIGKVVTLASNSPGATTVATVVGTSDTWTNGPNAAANILEIPCTTKFTLTAGVTYCLFGGITSGSGTTALGISAPPDLGTTWPSIALPGSFGANVVCAVNPPIVGSAATVSTTAGSRLWVGIVGHLV